MLENYGYVSGYVAAGQALGGPYQTDVDQAIESYQDSEIWNRSELDWDGRIKQLRLDMIRYYAGRMDALEFAIREFEKMRKEIRINSTAWAEVTKLGQNLRAELESSRRLYHYYLGTIDSEKSET